MAWCGVGEIKNIVALYWSKKGPPRNLFCCPCALPPAHMEWARRTCYSIVHHGIANPRFEQNHLVVTYFFRAYFQSNIQSNIQSKITSSVKILNVALVIDPFFRRSYWKISFSEVCGMWNCTTPVILLIPFYYVMVCRPHGSLSLHASCNWFQLFWNSWTSGVNDRDSSSKTSLRVLSDVVLDQKIVERCKVPDQRTQTLWSQ